MSIALIIFGISYSDLIVHWAKKDLFKIDYRESIKNYKENIFNAYPKSNIDVFFSTYDSKLKNKLISDYKPKSYNLFKELKYEIKNKRIGKNSNVIESIKKCLE